MKDLQKGYASCAANWLSPQSYAQARKADPKLRQRPVECTVGWVAAPGASSRNLYGMGMDQTIVIAGGTYHHVPISENSPQFNDYMNQQAQAQAQQSQQTQPAQDQKKKDR
jgi:hypothetical protein